MKGKGMAYYWLSCDDVYVDIIICALPTRTEGTLRLI